MIGVLFLLCIPFYVSGQDRRSRSFEGRQAESGREDRGEIPTRKEVREPEKIKPNLILKSLSLSSARVDQGDEVTATAVVACEGIEVFDPVRVRFSLGEKMLGTSNISLSRRKAGTASFAFPAGREGEHKVIAHVNPDGAIQKSKTDDNAGSQEIFIKHHEVVRKEPSMKPTAPLLPLPSVRPIEPPRAPEPPTDLVLTELNVNNMTPSLGEEVIVTAKIQNMGKKEFRNVPVRFYLGQGGKDLETRPGSR